MDFFIFKKIVSVALMPINIAILCMVIAIVAAKAKPKLARRSTMFSLFILFMSSFPFVSDRLMNSLEQDYESFTRSPVPLDYIVILGCGHQTNDALPVTSQLKPCSLQRLVEGIRISRLHPEARIITSGYSISDPVPNAVRVKQAAIALGVPASKIITENFPKDTKEEAELISPRVKGTNVVLVTDAYHLPRAIRYFQLQGVDPIPAPAGYYVKDIDAPKHWLYYFPSAKSLFQTGIAWYETMGRAWQWIAY